jgi:hypothetical protein
VRGPAREARATLAPRTEPAALRDAPPARLDRQGARRTRRPRRSTPLVSTKPGRGRVASSARWSRLGGDEGSRTPDLLIANQPGSSLGAPLHARKHAGAIPADPQFEALRAAWVRLDSSARDTVLRVATGLAGE